MFSSVSWSWVSGPSVAAQSAPLVGGAPAKIWGSPGGLANLVVVAFWGGPANGIPAFCIEEEDGEGGKRVESGEGNEAQVVLRSIWDVRGPSLTSVWSWDQVGRGALVEEGGGQRSVFSALLCDGDRERCLMALSRCGGPAGAGDEAAATLMDGDQSLGRCCRSKSPQWLRHADRLSSSRRAVVGVGDLSALVTIQRPGFSLDRFVMLVENPFFFYKKKSSLST